MFDPLNAHCYIFRSEYVLDTETSIQLEKVFSLYTDSAETKQRDIKEEWYKNIFKYSDDTWFIFTDAKSDDLSEELYPILKEQSWYLVQIGDDYSSYGDKGFHEWMRYHLDF